MKEDKKKELAKDGIGHYIRLYRVSYNLKQSDLAKQLGVSRGAVGMWETGKITPSAKMLAILAEWIPKQPKENPDIARIIHDFLIWYEGGQTWLNHKARVIAQAYTDYINEIDHESST